MPSVLIISPDPEARRMLQLAFELEGLLSHTAIDAGEAKALAPQADGIILDMVDGSAPQWEEARRVIKLGVTPTTFLLPRGWDERKAPKATAPADLLVRKPYELLGIIRQVKGMVEARKRPQKKKKPTLKKVAAKKKKAKHR